MEEGENPNPSEGKTLEAQAKELAEARGLDPALVEAYATGISDLARQVGSTRQLVRYWAVTFDGFPKPDQANRYKVAEVLRFMERRNLGKEQSSVNPDYETQRARRLALQNERLEMENAKARGDLVPLVDVKQKLTKTVLEWRDRMISTRAGTTGRLKALTGGEFNEIDKILAEWTQDLLEAMSRDKWQPRNCPHCKTEIE